MAISPCFLSEPSNILHKSDELVVHFFINRMALPGKELTWRGGGCVKSHSPYYKSRSEACMGSIQSVVNFLGLSTRPYKGIYEPICA